MLINDYTIKKVSVQTFSNINQVDKELTSVTKNVWAFLINNDVYLSSTFKKLIPITGNRVCIIQCMYYFLTIDNNGKLTNKKRIP